MPTTREIQEHFGFASQTAAMGHLRALERKGLIVRHPNKARAVVLAEFNEQQGELPVISLYEDTAPDPMDPKAQKEPAGSIAFDLTSLGKLQSNSTFAFRVNSDSMSDAGIFKGDIVICEPSIPKDKDVVVILRNGKSVLKRFVHMMSSTFYVEENSSPAEPFPAKDAPTQGVVVAMIRCF